MHICVCMYVYIYIYIYIYMSPGLLPGEGRGAAPHVRGAL